MYADAHATWTSDHRRTRGLVDNTRLLVVCVAVLEQHGGHLSRVKRWSSGERDACSDPRRNSLARPTETRRPLRLPLSNIEAKPSHLVVVKETSRRRGVSKDRFKCGVCVDVKVRCHTVAIQDRPQSCQMHLTMCCCLYSPFRPDRRYRPSSTSSFRSPNT